MQTQDGQRTLQLASRSERTSWVLLVAGVLAASTSAIFVRYAHGAGPLAISFWRCSVGALALAPVALPRLRAHHGGAGLDRPALWSATLAGIFLALHFGFWITGLGLTAVASAVLLVTASPIFVATFDRIFFGQRLRALGWGGIGVSLAGTALVVGGDFHGTSLLGDGLALLGGIAVAAYTLAGRQARRSLGIFEYAFIAYAVAGICLFGATLVSHEALGGYDPATWWAIVALIVGPQLLGHTIINLVLKDIDATAISVTIMLEPVVATLLAFVLFAETPSALFYPGAVAILTGIFMTSLVTRPQPVVPE